MSVAVTMHDVARAAGVSVMTVSNVLNGRPRVGPETRERVLAVVEELGYVLDLNARRLRTGRTGTVALVVPRFDHHYYAELAAQLAAAFAERGQHLVVEQSNASRENELAALSPARLRFYDGIVLSAVGLTPDDVAALRGTVPLVLLGERELPGVVDHVMMSNTEGARLATEHLLDRGARRIAVLGGAPPAVPGAGTSREPGGIGTLRTEGWREAHRARGLEPPEELVAGVPGLALGMAREVLTGLLDRAPDVDAVFAITDQLAVSALAALHELGLRVPEDIRVIGFDNLELLAQVPPGLSTIDPSNGWIVERAVELLERRIADPGAEAVVLASPVRVVERGSTR
ncbi:LacI family DNA-binding transcriptional regulator [Salana multivorans]